MNITHVFEDVPLIGKYDAGAGYLSGHADIEFGADADWIISAIRFHGDSHGIAIGATRRCSTSLVARYRP